MPKFRQKPIVIEADQFFPESKPWPIGVYRIGGSCVGEDEAGKDVWCRVDINGGEQRIHRGDWVVRDPNGEPRVIDANLFAQLYEVAE